MQDEKTGYAFWHREEPSSILRRHAKRPDVPSYGIATDSIDWVFTKIDQALIGSYIETLLDASPENDTRLWDHQKRLNIREFQAVYTDKELATIGITDLDYPRIPRMVQSFSLEFWRGTAVLKFWRIWTEKILKSPCSELVPIPTLGLMIPPADTTQTSPSDVSADRVRRIMYSPKSAEALIISSWKSPSLETGSGKTHKDSPIEYPDLKGMGRCGNQPQQFYSQNVEWWETLAIAKATRELDRIAMGPLLAHKST
ncbi:transcription termination factor 2 [Aspergillus tubingensis]|uniref:Uncharacterized protein n=1 Tax=Aspergillus niger TaxID=5061 RepID=A0A117DVH0_ASPNG|nr:transcription termination factor 2 [Aspergillus tubingensis]GAQ34957.1 hypothetical protein ABL_00975 [Aspergillus niger]GFN16343.1 transcription termination factor 2 [Aspergillus tubingensis]